MYITVSPHVLSPTVRWNVCALSMWDKRIVLKFDPNAVWIYWYGWKYHQNALSKCFRWILQMARRSVGRFSLPRSGKWIGVSILCQNSRNESFLHLFNWLMKPMWWTISRIITTLDEQISQTDHSIQTLKVQETNSHDWSEWRWSGGRG